MRMFTVEPGNPRPICRLSPPTEIAPKMRTADWNAAFDCRIEQVLVDEVDETREAGAYVSSGITYVNPRRAADLERGRRVVAELLER